jgi:hypothetical protein
MRRIYRRMRDCAGDWLIRPRVAFSGIFASGHGFTTALRSQMPLA